MRNIMLVIEYDGTDYCGWQVQNAAGQRPSVQKAVESVLGGVLQEKIRVYASGRTDAGVHAIGQVAHFSTVSKLPAPKILHALNSLLPKDIAISRVKEVPSKFHSRFSAKAKLYRYTILNRLYPGVFCRRFSWYVPQPLDITLMRKGARLIKGKRDFRGFQTSGSPRKGHSRRHVQKLTVQRQGDFIFIDIKADGFLYNMARNIAGTLVETGKGRVLDIHSIFSSGQRKLAGMTAPAQGLCLVKVYY